MLTYIQEFIAKNVCNPQSGVGAWMMKHLFVRSNSQLIVNVVKLLDIHPDHMVLELGYGPGVGIEEAVAFVTEGKGKIFGIDISEPMLKEASRRLDNRIKEGKVALTVGDAESLPYSDMTFDRVFHTNCYYFWSDQLKVSKEIYRVMKPGAVMVTALQKDLVKKSMSRGFLKYGNPDIDNFIQNLKSAGFINVRTQDRVMADGTMPFTSIHAEKSQL